MNLFFDSRFYRPVQALLSRSEAALASTLPGFQFNFPPVEMLSGPPDADGLAPWTPIDSPINARMIAGIERFIGKVLPDLFKDYLSSKCFIDMDLYDAILPDVDPRRPLSWLEWYALRSELTPYRNNPFLLPFTFGPAMLSDLCFDTNRPLPGKSDYPVVILHHDEYFEKYKVI